MQDLRLWYDTNNVRTGSDMESLVETKRMKNLLLLRVQHERFPSVKHVCREEE